MKKTESNKAAGQLDFNQLVVAIRYADAELSAQASRAVNISLTLRNWLIGCYIAEYELNGEDRAAYGEKVLSELSLRLNDISNCNRRQLYRYLRFYRLYPQIVATLSPQFQRLLPVSLNSGIVGTASPLSEHQRLSLLERLSYSHIEQLVAIEEVTKRAFYEVECIRKEFAIKENIAKKLNNAVCLGSRLSEAVLEEKARSRETFLKTGMGKRYLKNRLGASYL